MIVNHPDIHIFEKKMSGIGTWTVRFYQAAYSAWLQYGYSWFSPDIPRIRAVSGPFISHT